MKCYLACKVHLKRMKFSFEVKAPETTGSKVTMVPVDLWHQTRQNNYYLVRLKHIDATEPATTSVTSDTKVCMTQDALHYFHFRKKYC